MAVGKALFDAVVFVGTALMAAIGVSEMIEEGSKDYSDTADTADCSTGCNNKPPPDLCKKAIKLLSQYDRLMKKLGKKLPPSRLKILDELRQSGNITSDHLPGSIQSEFPGQFKGKTLAEIKKICGM